MTEIYSTDFEEPYYDKKSPDPDFSCWEKVGRIALWTSVFIGGAAFVPALIRKKRVYSLTPAVSSFAPLLPEPVSETVTIQETTSPPKVPRCNSLEKQKIHKIITTVAQGGFSLAFPSKIRELNALGDEIRHIHTFEFLRVAPKQALRKIFKETLPFKRDNVLAGVTQGLEKERVKNNLMRFVPAFAVDIGTTPDVIRPLIQAGDWRGLVLHVLEVSGDPEE